jgi:hypothetical protein
MNAPFILSICYYFPSEIPAFYIGEIIVFPNENASLSEEGLTAFSIGEIG